MRLVYARRAVDDLSRLADFLRDNEPASAVDIVAMIEEAVMILERHPFIGRKVDDRLRELVISRGKSGYVALYSYLEPMDTVMVLAIRHQREAGNP